MHRNLLFCVVNTLYSVTVTLVRFQSKFSLLGQSVYKLLMYVLKFLSLNTYSLFLSALAGCLYRARTPGAHPIYVMYYSLAILNKYITCYTVGT